VARVSKYHSRRVNTPEGWFDSQAELKRWGDLKLLERAGKITNLERQVRFEIIPKIGRLRAIFYVADFAYDLEGKRVIEDRKGFKTRLYRLKARLMLWRHNIEILET
jgi:hypothetical protein